MTFFIRHTFLCDFQATSLATFWSYRLCAAAVRRCRAQFIPLFEWAIWWKFHSPKHEIWDNLNIFIQRTLFCESGCHAPSHLLVKSTLGEVQGGQPVATAGPGAWWKFRSSKHRHLAHFNILPRAAFFVRSETPKTSSMRHTSWDLAIQAGARPCI